MRDVERKVTLDAKRLMRYLEAEFRDPGDAFFACVLAVAVIGKGSDMPVNTVCEGIRAAYDDLSVGGQDVH